MRKARNVSPGSIHIEIPKVIQETNYTCGVAVFSAICRYFEVKFSKKHIKKLKADPDGGTAPENIIKTLTDLGFNVTAKEMTVRKIKSLIKKQIPVICPIQQHYVIAIGFNDGKIFFLDPLFGIGFLSEKTFLNQWKAVDKHGNRFLRFGIAVF